MEPINDENYDNTINYLKNKINKKFNPDKIYNFDKKIRSNNELVYINRKRQFTIQSLAQQELKIEPEQEQNLSPTLKIKKIKLSKKNVTSENDVNDKEAKTIKSKIFGVVKKEANNIEIFPKKLKKKSMELIKIIEQFNKKVSESHAIFKNSFSSNPNNVNQNFNEKNFLLKNNLNYFDLYIFEKNIIEFYENQILFFIDLLNYLNKIYDSNFNSMYIKEFYSKMTKNDNNLTTICKDSSSCFNTIELIKQNNNSNSNSSSHNSDYFNLNTISNSSLKNKISSRLLLPSLENSSKSKISVRKRN